MNAIHNYLETHKLCGLIFEDPLDLYYFTHKNISLGTFIVTPKKRALFVDGRYKEACASVENEGIELYNYSNEEKTVFIKNNALQNVGFNGSTTPYKKYTEWKKIFDTLEKQLIPQDNLSHTLRIIKTKEEEEKLIRAADLGSRGFDFLLPLLKEGVTEKQLAHALRLFWLDHEGEFGFDPIISFGKNTAFPHYTCADIPLKKGDPVLIDIGVCLDHYHSDMTRTLFFGTPDPKLLTIYDQVHAAQEKVLQQVRPETHVDHLDQIARDFFKEHNCLDHFLHSLGHGIGLEIHEAPRLSVRSKEGPLKPGMAITVEPGLYYSNLGGVRIEDTILITPTGYKDLTSRPKDPLILKTA